MSDYLHMNANALPWSTNPAYPEALQQIVRWKILVGGESLPSVPQDDIMMGVLDLDAGGDYPLHAHAAPELYFVISGQAEWTVGDQTFTAEAGTAIYHPPHAPHRMVNTGDQPLRTIWFWWSPGGQRDVLKGEVVLLDTSD